MDLGIGSTTQLAFVVDDLDKAMARWQRTAKTGPFYVFRKVSGLEVVYRGAATPLEMSIGLAQIGPVHVELIQQHSPEASVYRDVYEEGSGGGFHHVCFPVPDVDAAVDYYTDAGFDVGMRLDFSGTPVAYIDTRPSIGCMTELIRNDQAIMDLYDSVAAAATDWDGSNPIRDL